MQTTPHRGDEDLRLPGYSYLPRFVSAAESDSLIAYFASLRPIWEKRHYGDEHGRAGGVGRGLSRPVYWLGAWQFASMGYYSEPDHVRDKCLRAEPIPPVMQGILDRLLPELEAHTDDGDAPTTPNTCLMNYYGRIPGHPPRDLARLRMHRDGEPGPVVMLSAGQPGLLEFVDPDDPDEPALAQWLRHRSVVILSGPRFKDHLYHRVTRVRLGDQPAMSANLDDFELRRVSVSFRHVPENAIRDLDQLAPDAREKALPYVRELANSSPHFRAQLDRLGRP